MPPSAYAPARARPLARNPVAARRRHGVLRRRPALPRRRGGAGRAPRTRPRATARDRAALRLRHARRDRRTARERRRDGDSLPPVGRLDPAGEARPRRARGRPRDLAHAPSGAARARGCNLPRVARDRVARAEPGARVGHIRMSNIDHIDLVVSSLEASLPFYRGLLEPLGWRWLHEVDGERGETIHYLFRRDGRGSIGLRQQQSDSAGAYDRYSV